MKILISAIEKVLFLLVIFLFAFIPLYPKFPLFNVAGTFVAVRIEDLFIALTFALWAVFIFLSGSLKKFLGDKLNLALILFFAVGLLAVFSANFLTHTVTPHLSFLHWLRRVEFMMLLPIVATIVRTRKQFLLIVTLLSVVVLLVNIYALGQQYLNWPVISTTNTEFSKGLILRLTEDARVNSTFAGHYDLAVFLAMTLVLVASLFFMVRNLWKLWMMVLILLSTWVLVMTAARLSFVAAALGIFTALFLLGKKKYLALFIVILTLILIYPSQLRDRLISTVTVNIFNLGQKYEGKTEDQRIRSRLNIPSVAIKTSSESAQTAIFATQSGQTPTDITPGEPVDTTQLGVYRSFAIRFNIEWPRAINAFIKNPLLGTGYSSLDIATDNDFLRSLGEVGILGTISFGFVLLEAVKRIYSKVKSDDRLLRYFSVGILSMIAAFLINGLFIDVFEASKVASLFWMIVGLALAASRFR